MHLFGVHIDETTYEDVLENIHDRLSSAQQTRLFTPNPEMLLQASRDDEYAGILDSADISVPDGMGLFVAYQACRDGLQTYPYQTLPLVKYLMLPWW